jgi:hypothetical protein
MLEKNLTKIKKQVILNIRSSLLNGTNNLFNHNYNIKLYITNY